MVQTSVCYLASMKDRPKGTCKTVQWTVCPSSQLALPCLGEGELNRGPAHPRLGIRRFRKLFQNHNSPGKSPHMLLRYFQRFIGYPVFLVIIGGTTLLLAGGAAAQSTRPRRTQPKQDSLLLPQPTPTPARKNSNVPLLDIKPVKPV